MKLVHLITNYLTVAQFIGDQATTYEHSRGISYLNHNVGLLHQLVLKMEFTSCLAGKAIRKHKSKQSLGKMQDYYKVQWETNDLFWSSLSSHQWKPPYPDRVLTSFNLLNVRDLLKHEFQISWFQKPTSIPLFPSPSSSSSPFPSPSFSFWTL